MNVAHTLVNVLFDVKSPPPPGGWLNDLPEAFGALDEKGEVFIIGYKGEWYTPIKPTVRTRIHNWLVTVGNKKIAKDELSLPPAGSDESNRLKQLTWTNLKAAMYHPKGRS